MNREFITKYKVAAFSLTELLVVLIIIGVLVLIALPNLMPIITKAKSTEAKIQLNHLHTLQKAYFYEFSRYSNNPEDLGFEQEKLTTDGGQANYQIELTEVSSDGFVATATAVVDFDRDGVFNVWQIDQDKHLVETIKD